MIIFNALEREVSPFSIQKKHIARNCVLFIRQLKFPTQLLILGCSALFNVISARIKNICIYFIWGGLNVWTQIPGFTKFAFILQSFWMKNILDYKMKKFQKVYFFCLGGGVVSGNFSRHCFFNFCFTIYFLYDFRTIEVRKNKQYAEKIKISVQISKKRYRNSIVIISRTYMLFLITMMVRFVLI